MLHADVNEKLGMTPIVVMAKLLHRLNKLPDGSCGRLAMGNDHSRKPLLPIFKHLEEVSIEELQAVYTRYRYKLSPRRFLRGSNTAPYFLTKINQSQPSIRMRQSMKPISGGIEREFGGFDEKAEDRSHR